jgi:hypothetical protein
MFGVMKLESQQPTIYFFLKGLHRFVNFASTGDAGEVKFQDKILSRLDFAIFDSFIDVETLTLV